MKFINRKKELELFENLWTTKKPQLFVLYGKRRVGKTELIKQLLKNKPGVYFLADKRTVKDQLMELGRIIGKQFDDTVLMKRGFIDWLDVFDYVKQKAKTPFIFAIDEYPYLVEGDKATSSLFQKGWDEYLKQSQIKLILSGSSVAMMESEALQYKSPLYGRRTGQLLLKPLSFYQAREFFAQKSFAEFLSLYSVAGGLPAYLLELDPHITVRENIKKNIFPRTSFLHNEIEFILKEELREPKNYLTILHSLSLGKTKLGEIINETGLERNVVHKYLGTLERLQLVERTVPVTEKNAAKSRMGLYKITDHFTKFWFQYIYPYKSDLEIEKYDEVVRKLDESFQFLEATTYEKVCQEILARNEDHFFRFERIGKWWYREQEIDLMAINETERAIVFGECKWSNKPVGSNVYMALKQKAALVDWHTDDRKEYVVLFSRSGFTHEMTEIAKREHVVLVEQDRIIT